LPEPDHGQHPLLLSEKAAWLELFTKRAYRGRIVLIMVWWLCCNPAMIYGVGAFVPLPAFLIRGFGIRQRRAALEQMST
jgi:hypothetical protein